MLWKRSGKGNELFLITTRSSELGGVGTVIAVIENYLAALFLARLSDTTYCLHLFSMAWTCFYLTIHSTFTRKFYLAISETCLFHMDFLPLKIDGKRVYVGFWKRFCLIWVDGFVFVTSKNTLKY